MLNIITDKCEAEAKWLAQRATKKRSRDDTPNDKTSAVKKGEDQQCPPLVFNCAHTR